LGYLKGELRADQMEYRLATNQQIAPAQDQQEKDNYRHSAARSQKSTGKGKGASLYF
jgi:hypothetical protein